MKLNNVFADKEAQSISPAKKPSVVISTNLKRERVLLDADGNQINNFKAKQIINKVEDN